MIFGDKHISTSQRHGILKQHLRESMQKDIKLSEQKFALLRLKHGHLHPQHLHLSPRNTRIRIALEYLQAVEFGRPDQLYNQLVGLPIDEIDTEVLRAVIEATAEGTLEEAFKREAFSNHKLMRDAMHVFRRIITRLSDAGADNATHIEAMIEGYGRQFGYTDLVKIANRLTKQLQAAEPESQLELLDPHAHANVPPAFFRLLHVMLNYGTRAPDVRAVGERCLTLAKFAAQLFATGSERKGEETRLTIADLLLQHPDASNQEIVDMIEQAQRTGRTHAVYGKLPKPLFSPGRGIVS